MVKLNTTNFTKREGEMSQKGLKYDQSKLRYDLVPVEAHEALAEVISYGAQKYSDNNWQQVSKDRYVAALFRHINAWRKA